MRNKKKICTLLILMMMGTITVAQNSVYANDEDTVLAVEQKEIKGNKDAFETAQELINKKDFQSALAYLNAYVSSKPKKYEGYKLRGEAYYALRRYDLASKDFQTAIDLKTDDDKFITGTKVLGAVVLGADKQEQRQNPELGNLYARLMYAQKALNNPAYENSYAKAVEFNSHIYLPQPKKDEISQINCPQKYGKMFNPQGDDKFLYEAIEDIEKENFRESIFKSQYIISKYPDYYMGYYLNGVALAGLEQDEDALVAFENSLNRNPYDFESIASIGQIYYSKAEKTFSVDDAKKSNEYFKKALKFNPNCHSYYFYIGLNELQLGNISNSIDNFNNAIKLKPNDYNSLYYKLIAQYINGDYDAVVDGCTKLLYKHVSNYNSVLYLRALAYYKTNSYDLALVDLEKIYNNTNDIYNSDIHYVSDKEKTLTSYVYYLKSQILSNQGQGSKSDAIRAYQNPIIAKLAIAERVIKPYQAKMSSETIAIEDYNKFNNAYRIVPSLLKTNTSITVEDIDSQYDYIRTTFDDLGITFVYTNPYYQMSVIDNYVAKKYHSKLAAKNTQSSDIPNLGLRPREEDKPILKAHTPEAEKLVPENITSIAQMLASQSLIADDIKSVKETANSNSIEDVIASVPEAKSQDDARQTFDKEAQQVLENQPEAENVVSESVQQTKDSNEEVVTELEKVDENNLAEVEQTCESVKIVAEEIKETEDFTISYQNVETQPVTSKDEVSTSEEVNEKIAEAIGNVAEIKVDSQINEKFADINPSDYGVPSSKPLPVIENPDDVVMLEPQSFNFMANQQMKVEPFEIKNPNKITDDFSATKLAENPAETQVYQEEIEERIVLPETEEYHTDGNSDETIITAKKQDSIGVPVVIVPEISTPVIKPEDKLQKYVEEIDEDKISNEQTFNTLETQAVQISTDTANSLDPEKPANADKVKKQKVKKQKIKKVNSEKPVKIKKENQIKESVEKPVKEKKIRTKKVKPVKEEKLTEQEKAINSIITETFGASETGNEIIEPVSILEVQNTKTEKPVKEIKPKKEKVKKIKEPELNNLDEEKILNQETLSEEVNVNLSQDEVPLDNEQSKKKKKKKFHWWFKKRK